MSSVIPGIGWLDVGILERDTLVRQRGCVMDSLFQTSREPKVLELEKTDDGQLRLIITLQKLGVVTKLEYFLDRDEALSLSRVLGKEATS